MRTGGATGEVRLASFNPQSGRTASLTGLRCNKPPECAVDDKARLSMSATAVHAATHATAVHAATHATAHASVKPAPSECCAGVPHHAAGSLRGPPGETW